MYLVSVDPMDFSNFLAFSECPNFNKLTLDDYGTHLELVWNPSGPSEVPYSNWSGTIFCRFLQQTGSTPLVVELIRAFGVMDRKALILPIIW